MQLREGGRVLRAVLVPLMDPRENARLRHVCATALHQVTRTGDSDG